VLDIHFLSGTRAIEREFFAAGGELQELVPSSTLTNGWDRMKLASAYNEAYNTHICTFHNVFRRNMQQHMSSSFRVCVCVYIAVSVWREKREKELKGGPTCLIE
jgi:hypothetical protein